MWDSGHLESSEEGLSLTDSSFWSALTAKSVVLPLSQNKDCGAAAYAVVSNLKGGHHSDGRWLPGNPQGENPA